MFDDEQGVYTIGTVAELVGEHPETLRVWERQGLIKPDRSQYQRRYSNSDLKRLKFIKHLMDQCGLNVAGVRQLIGMYSCWYNRNCKGGAAQNSKERINESKPCWKEENTYCLVAQDKAEICSTCDMVKRCVQCSGCKE